MLTALSLQWKAEIMDFCPSTRIILVGCKTDLRTDVCTLMELSNQRLTPISHEQVSRSHPPHVNYLASLFPSLTAFCLSFYMQGTLLAKQVGAEVYLECSAFTSEKSIHSVFRSAAQTCLNKLQPPIKQSPTRRLSKRLLHLPSKAELLTSSFSKERTKSCSIMWAACAPHKLLKKNIFLLFERVVWGGLRGGEVMTFHDPSLSQHLCCSSSILTPHLQTHSSLRQRAAAIVQGFRLLHILVSIEFPLPAYGFTWTAFCINDQSVRRRRKCSERWTLSDIFVGSLIC